MIPKPYWHWFHEGPSPFFFMDKSISFRLKQIRENKPVSEWATRKRLLKPVKGKLPAAVVKARAAYDKAGAAYDKAWAAYDKAWAACDKAWTAYDKAWTAYDKAIRDNMPAILKLHAKECGCGWTPEWPNIFPKEAGK